MILVKGKEEIFPGPKRGKKKGDKIIKRKGDGVAEREGKRPLHAQAGKEGKRGDGYCTEKRGRTTRIVLGEKTNGTFA